MAIACVSIATKVIKSADPRAMVEIGLTSRRVRVESAEDHEVMEAALADAGYVPAERAWCWRPSSA